MPEPRNVLYIALEGTRAGLRARTAALARGMGVDPDGDDLWDRLYFLYKPPGLNLSDARWRRNSPRSRTALDVGLVVVDVLRRAAEVREDGNGAGDFTRSMGNLRPLELAGRAVAIAHHFTKASETSRGRVPAERMAGSGALYGAMDVGMFIVKLTNDARQLEVTVEARDIAAPAPFTVSILGEGSGKNGGFTYRDRAVAVCSDEKIPTEADVLAEQLRVIREGDPEVTQTRAAAIVGATRFKKDFQAAWEASGARVCSPNGEHTQHRLADGGGVS